MPHRIRGAAPVCASLTVLLSACAVSVSVPGERASAAACCQQVGAEPRPLVATAHPSRCDDYPVTHRAEPGRAAALRVLTEPAACR